ncbi:AzlC family ABC transporter permease [Flocculibacter collagenilyticus]|uniref:AzlC family ABC transporter permease n=1 Tax=Flocculibacter collagenilyticus TaxID=2744479 RepID=UPI0018F495F9|nr:AzlC family ABC transporter permease [Flocculibacter collagenilyticus]
MKVAELSTNIAYRAAFLAGIKHSIPLVIGAIPFGIIFGTLAQQQGLALWFTQSLSIFVFAGSSQFIALGLLATGAAPWLIIATTFVVNLRHMLYAASLLPYMHQLPQRIRALMCFGLTDETYVVAIKRYEQTSESASAHYFYLGSMFAMYVNWQICTLLGYTVGEAVPEIGQWGLEVAMPITFIGIVAPYLINRAMWATVVTAGTLAVLLHHLPHQLGLIVSVIVAVICGVIVNVYMRIPSPAIKSEAGMSKNQTECEPTKYASVQEKG